MGGRLVVWRWVAHHLLLCRCNMCFVLRQEVQSDWSTFVRRWPGAAPSACNVAAGIIDGRVILSIDITEYCAVRSAFMTAAAATLSHFHSKPLHECGVFLSHLVPLCAGWFLRRHPTLPAEAPLNVFAISVHSGEILTSFCGTRGALCAGAAASSGA